MTQLSAELLKLRTTRGPWVLLGLVVLLSGVAAATVASAEALTGDRVVELAQATGAAATLALLLGILVVTSEYRHGTIAATFLVEPRRERVLAAKLAAAVCVGLVFAAAAIVTALAVAAPFHTLADGQVEAFARVVLAFVLWALVGAAAGAVVQSQVGAIGAVLVWFFVLEPLLAVFSLAVLGRDVGDHLLGAALGGVVEGDGRATLLALAYVAALTALGALAVARRDP